MGRLSLLPVTAILLVAMLINASCGNTTQSVSTTTTDTTEIMASTTPIPTTTVIPATTTPPVTTPVIVTTTTKTLITNAVIIPLDFDPSYILISPKDVNITTGESQIYTAMAYDNEGTALDITSATSFTIEKEAGGRWIFNNYTSENTGIWKVTGLYLDPVDGYESWTDFVTLVVKE